MEDHDQLSFTAAALAAAIAEARAKIGRREFSFDLVLLVRHCRELRYMLLEHLLEREPNVPEFLHGLVTSLDAQIKELEAQVPPDPPNGKRPQGK